MQSFQELNLPEQIARALTAMKYKTPTPIQAQSIPVALTNRDLIGCAQTGTGKTVAFGTPLVCTLLKVSRKNALILAPTRELAAQIDKVIGELTQFLPDMRRALLIGGVAMGPQERALGKKPRIVIATPGRLIDHLDRGNLSLSASEVVVLDEADRMLDMGFADQINRIMRFLPKSRQTLLYSATLPPDILKLAAKYLKDPVRVTVGTASKPIQKIVQKTIEATNSNKNDVLCNELDTRVGSVLVFARTKRRTDRIARYLAESGYKTDRIHGDRSQKQRNEAIEGFRAGKFRVLVATDIAARGIDIPHIAHVINYDLPQVPEDYVHRIGRTARAGATGEALSLISPEEWTQWRMISKFLAQAAAVTTPR